MTDTKTESSGNRRLSTILIADDEEEVRDVVRQILEEKGYEVVEARDGVEALQAVSQFKVDLIVLDLVMPEKEGIETLRILVRSHSGIKILAISGAFSGLMLECAKSLGADDVLKKPFSCEAILQKVEQLLEPTTRSTAPAP
jgi:CheY-like chemotaxis protein